ncbi:hypothetical protein [Streptococcus ruminantium]|uniref:Uncharacterized protein n=1 Tax=Streptococcus ruminantium TaxID=1917441 RepID=A0ABU1B4E0_9STRE|nr:hypothetical protein [Streptococcus ruminantium]MDQ8759334.1 hypothetical protein [Streptococcus ruminantium]MDQ8764566.1 hypothetical protein [Streptococcus ruminantium]MDQ8769307.1 hypothetical protein [Streptococcus ruminantium]MDQ8774537.1 hypothetical protein [Streptococcus ruminantium]MDQ8794585.1 hypothetical protein [Streptococcus ruminantium]
MTYQIIDQTVANAEAVEFDSYIELVSYLDIQNYRARNDGAVGTMLSVRRLSDGQVVMEKIVQLGYTEYTEDLLSEFDGKQQVKRASIFKRVFQKLLPPKKKKEEKGNEAMTTTKKPWVYDGEPLEEPTAPSQRQEKTETVDVNLNGMSPDEARAAIARQLQGQSPAGKSETTTTEATTEVNYAEKFQEQQARNEVGTSIIGSEISSSEVVPSPGSTELEKTTVVTVSTASEASLPAKREHGEILDPVVLNKESLIKNIARITQERSQIREKILANNAIIEQARQAELENEALEAEYQHQEEVVQKLQHFHNLFDTLREYLN